MAYIRGENLNIGVGLEDTSNRGDFVGPQAWISGRTPTGINVEVVKALLKETKASGLMSRGSEVVQRHAGGDLEFNLRSESIGYLLKSLLGACDSQPNGAAFDHTFTVLASDPQYPTLSIVLSQLGYQDYKYVGTIAKSLEIRTPVDDLVNATVELISLDEEEVVDHTPAFADSDYTFRPYEATIKVASDLAGLSGADPIKVKEFTLSIENNGHPQQHIGSITPTDNLTGLLEIGGDIVLDYQGDTYHDIYRDGDYQALEISFERSDVDLGGGVHPTLTIQLARVSFEASDPDRPLDDIIADKFKFLAHYSDDDAEGINIVLTNGISEYTQSIYT